MSYKGRQYWNHLPPELKNQEKTKPFKSELKERCLQKYMPNFAFTFFIIYNEKFLYHVLFGFADFTAFFYYM